MVIFHGKLLNYQMVTISFLGIETGNNGDTIWDNVVKATQYDLGLKLVDFALAPIYGGNCHGEDDDNPLELGVPYCQKTPSSNVTGIFGPKSGWAIYPIREYLNIPPSTCIVGNVYPHLLVSYTHEISRLCFENAGLLSSMCSGREDMEIMRKWQSIYSRGLPTFSITGLLSIDTQLGVAIGFVQKRALTVPF